MTFVSTAARSGAGAGQLIKIIDTTLTGSAASIDLTPITTAYAHLQVIGRFRTDVAAVNDFCLMKFNGDGGANYMDEAQTGIGVAAPAAGQDVAQTRGFTFECLGATAPAGAFGHLNLLIPDYTDATFKSWLSQYGDIRGVSGSPANFRVAQGFGTWTQTAAITRLTFAPLTGPNFITGSRVTVYGLAVT